LYSRPRSPQKTCRRERCLEKSRRYALRVAEVTILGDFAVDRIDGGSPTAGGCAAFADAALRLSGAGGRIVARVARGDMPVLTAVLEQSRTPITLLETACTTTFSLRHAGEERSAEVVAVAERWTIHDLEAAAIDTKWVHVAPLLRTDFPVHLLQHLADRGHAVSYDGQGLVRSPRRGPLRLDARFDRNALKALRVLKLAQDEAEVIAGIPPDPELLAGLGVPEIIATFGSRGCDVYVSESRVHVPAARRVHGTHFTGAGDTFMVAYVAARASCTPPAESARRAAEVVATVLEER